MIRPACRGDASDIAEIWNQVIRETAHTFTTVEKTPDDVAGLIKDQCFLVWQEGGVLSGFATYGAFRSGPGYAHVGEHSLYVAQTAQRTGTGSALLQALEGEAKGAGIKVFVAGIGGENTRAQVFHARCGYVQVGHLPEVGQKFGKTYDLILMQKKL